MLKRTWNIGRQGRCIAKPRNEVQPIVYEYSQRSSVLIYVANGTAGIFGLVLLEYVRYMYVETLHTFDRLHMYVCRLCMYLIVKAPMFHS